MMLGRSIRASEVASTSVLLSPARNYPRIDPLSLDAVEPTTTAWARQKKMAAIGFQSCDAIHAHVVEDVTLYWPGLAVHNPTGRPIWDSFFHIPEKEMEARLAAASASVTRRRQIDGLVYLLERTGSNNYGHWLVETLGIYALAAPHFPEHRALVRRVPPRVHAQYKRGIALHECHPSGLLLHKKKQALLVERLIIPTRWSIPRERGVTSPDAMAKLQEVARRKEIARPGNGTRLFVSRNGHRRNASNAEEIERQFEAAGFQVIEPSHLTYLQQIELFSSATTVAGLVGAGLTNLVFSPPGASLLALIPGQKYSDFFYDLCCHNGRRYFCAHVSSRSTAAADEPFAIDPAVTERALKALGF